MRKSADDKKAWKVNVINIISSNACTILWTTATMCSISFWIRSCSFCVRLILTQSQQKLFAFLVCWNVRSLCDKQCGPRSDCSYRSTLLAFILNLSVMLGNYLQQTTSADDIFRCIFSWRFKGKFFIFQCCLLITFVNSLDPDQVWQIFEPDQGTICLTLGYIVLCLKELFKKKLFWGKISRRQKAWTITKKTGMGAN